MILAAEKGAGESPGHGKKRVDGTAVGWEMAVCHWTSVGHPAELEVAASSRVLCSWQTQSY